MYARKARKFFVKSSGTVPLCPSCGGNLSYRDARMRIRRKEGGRTDHLIIRRFRCEECGHYHNELPDCLLPYKHYESEVVTGVLDGVVTPDDQDSEDYPCFMTMLRWICWFSKNLENIEGFLRKVQSRIQHVEEQSLAGVSLLTALRTSSGNWLALSVRTVYNSGGYLPAFSL